MLGGFGVLASLGQLLVAMRGATPAIAGDAQANRIDPGVHRAGEIEFAKLASHDQKDVLCGVGEIALRHTEAPQGAPRESELLAIGRFECGEVGATAQSSPRTPMVTSPAIAEARKAFVRWPACSTSKPFRASGSSASPASDQASRGVNGSRIS